MRIIRPVLQTSTTPAVLRGLIRQNPVVAELVTEHHPLVAQAGQWVDRLIDAAAKIPEPVATGVPDQIRTALAEDRLGDVDLLDLAGGDALALARWHRAHVVLTAAVADMDAERTAAEESARRDLLPLLRQTLRTDLATLRAHPVVKAGARTAEAAITAGVAEAWGEYVALRQRLVHTLRAGDELRAAAGNGVHHSGRSGETMLARLAHPERVWDRAIVWFRYGSAGLLEDTGDPIGTPPWPADLADLPAFVDYLVESPAVAPWLPDAAEHDERVQAWREAARATTSGARAQVSPAARDLIEANQSAARLAHRR